jgi:thiol-disulfide isomerase/thioredoxin
MKTLTIIILAALLLLLVGWYLAAKTGDSDAVTEHHGADVGTSAKIVDWTDFNLGEYSDKIVILDFWASWCAPCRKQMPVLHRFYERLADDDCLEIIAVNLGESRAKVENFLEKYPMPYMIVLDRQHQIGRRFGVRAIPMLVIIDKGGKIIERRSGYSPSLEKDLQSLLHNRIPDCVPQT